MKYSFDQFWKNTLTEWKKLPVKERNFSKSIGIQPNKHVSMLAYEAMKRIKPVQLQLRLDFKPVDARVVSASVETAP